MIDFSKHSTKSESQIVTLVIAVAFALGALFYGLISNADGLGINVVLVQIGFVTAMVGLSRYFGHGVPHEGWIAAGFSLVFAAVFGIWTDYLSLGVAFFGLVVSQAVFVLYTVGHHMEFHHPVAFAFHAFFHLPLRVLSRIQVISRIQRPRVIPTHLFSVAIGVGVLIPILLVFGFLFSSADPLYADYLGRIFNIRSLPEGVQHLIGILFWSALFAGVLGLAFWKRATFPVSFRPQEKWHTESIVILTGVIVLFASFIALQATYLFGGEIAFSATNYTFSEYARRGFHELVAVATIVLFLFLSLRFLHGDCASRPLRVLHSLLFAETFLVLVSAVMRMNLYVEAYGYTPARLFTYWFLSAVAGLLLLALVHLLMNEAQARFLRQGLVLLGIFALGFIVSTPGAISMKLNVDRIVAAGRMDATDVLVSSPEAYSTLVYLQEHGVVLDGAKNGSTPSVRRALSAFYTPDDWRRWNLFSINREEVFPWFGCVTSECDFANK